MYFIKTAGKKWIQIKRTFFGSVVPLSAAPGSPLKWRFITSVTRCSWTESGSILGMGIGIGSVGIGIGWI